MQSKQGGYAQGDVTCIDHCHLQEKGRELIFAVYPVVDHKAFITGLLGFSQQARCEWKQQGHLCWCWWHSGRGCGKLRETIWIHTQQVALFTHCLAFFRVAENVSQKQWIPLWCLVYWWEIRRQRGAHLTSKHRSAEMKCITTMVEIQRLLIWTILLLTEVLSFNIAVDKSLLFHGDRNSYFGFSLAVYSNEDGKRLSIYISLGTRDKWKLHWPCRRGSRSLGPIFTPSSSFFSQFGLKSDVLMSRVWSQVSRVPLHWRLFAEDVRHNTGAACGFYICDFWLLFCVSDKNCSFFWCFFFEKRPLDATLTDLCRVHFMALYVHVYTCTKYDNVGLGLAFRWDTLFRWHYFCVHFYENQKYLLLIKRNQHVSCVALQKLCHCKSNLISWVSLLHQKSIFRPSLTGNVKLWLGNCHCDTNFLPTDLSLSSTIATFWAHITDVSFEQFEKFGFCWKLFVES